MFILFENKPNNNYKLTSNCMSYDVRVRLISILLIATFRLCYQLSSGDEVESLGLA